MRLLTISIIAFICYSCSQKNITYPTFDVNLTPSVPDYSNSKYWAALPTTNDKADLSIGKNGAFPDKQEDAFVDVFFIHPTIYTEDQKLTNPWNADIDNDEMNEKVDNSTIKYQATVFNGSGKIYAPRYRQAHINVFYPKRASKKISKSALDIAYLDVKDAFEYYLDKYNNGRPIIIGSHSQGTTHAIRLMKEFFDGKDINKKLVAAYIVGMPVKGDEFLNIPPCENASQTKCWVGWNTYAKGYYPKYYDVSYKDAVSTNPLNWKIDDTYAGYEANKGGILKKINKIIPELSDAQNHKGLLWINKPHFFGSFLINWDRYHVVDYGLFYMNVRENVAERVGSFLQKMEEE